MAQKPFKITIEKPFEGWIPSLWTSTGHALESAFDLMGQYSGYQEYSYSLAMMPNRPGFEGHLAPGPAFVAATDSGSQVTGLALNSVITSDGTVYVLLDNDKYVTLSSLSSPAVSATVSGTIGSTAGVHSGHSSFSTFNGDLSGFPAIIGTQVAYSGGTAYCYFSWEDSVDGDVAVLNGPANIGTQNYYTSLGGAALTKGVPHPLFNFGDKFIYIGNGQYLNWISPSLSSVQNQALILPPQWVIQGMAQYQNYIAIIAWQQNDPPEIPAQQGKSALFLWDGFSGTFNFQYSLNDFFVSNVYYDGQNLYAITYGRNGTTKLKQFNGTGFDILWESAVIGIPPGNVQHNGSPMIGGMDMWLNHIVWTNGDSLVTSLGNTGFINAYGSPESENYSSGFHQFAQYPNSGVSSLTRLGMIKNLYKNSVFIGVCDVNGAYSIQYPDFTKFALNGRFVSSLMPTPTNATIDNVKISFSQWGAGAALTMGIFKDYATLSYGGSNDFLQWNPTAVIYGTTTTYFYETQSIANVNSFYLAFDWAHASTSNTAAIIRKIEINGFSDDDNI